MEVAARIGWLARGALYLLLAVLVAGIPTARTAGRADKQGAFAALADSPYGGWLLGAVAVGMAAFAAWRLWSAVRGTEEKATHRVGWVGSALVYAAMTALAIGVLRGSESSANHEKAVTVRILTWPNGHLVVGLVAVALLVAAANYVRKAVTKRFLRDIDEGAVPRRLDRPVRVLGVVGWLGRAIVWGLIGWFLLRAAVQHDPNEPVGLDESLRALVDDAWGPTLLWLACVGMVAFALLCAATAAWPDPEPDS